MWLRSLVDRVKPGRSRAPARRTGRRPKACRPRLEALEDRSLPSFLPPVTYAAGVNPQAVAVGDFTGTGIPDLVVANHDSGTVSVLLGKGDGTFGPAQNVAVGGSPSSVAVGDFNNDGKLDIVTANYTPPSTPYTSGGTVTVLLGNGNGTFQPAINYVLPLQAGWQTQIPQSVAVGDFNKDGKLDVAVTADTFYQYWPPAGGYTTFIVEQGYVNVLIGNGAGGFTADNSYALGGPTWTSPYNFTPGSFTSSVAVGDFRGNGSLDLAVAQSVSNLPVWGNTGPISQVSVLLGNGNGTFGSPTVLASDFSRLPTSVAVGDFDGDKTLDIVTANVNPTNSNGSVSVFLGKGDGTFGTAANYTTGLGPTSVAVADFNRDAKLDIVTANSGATTVSMLLGNGNGTFQTHQDFAAGGWLRAVAVGDFNRDGWPDLAVTNNGVSVLINAADWSALPQASSFVFSGFPSPSTAGTVASFTVTAKNADGTTATGYTGTVHFTSSDPRAALAADYTLTPADQGVHTFSATLKTAGTQSITVTDTTTASITGTQTGIVVNPAAASQFIIIAPSSVTAGVQFSLTIKVEDAYGNVVTGYTGTIHFSSTDSTATLPKNYTFTAADKGVHTFTGLVLRKKGYQTIRITDTLNSSLTASVIVDVL